MMAMVSVVLCTQNGLSRGFLEEALHSVLEQSSPPAEVILVDDGSTDGTTARVRQDFPGVRILDNEGAGLAAARNTGIRAARHPLIAFIDDDDIWCPDKLTEQLIQMGTSQRPKETIWVARSGDIHGKNNGQGKPGQTPLQFTGWPACLLRCPVWHSGAMLPAALLRRIGPFEESLRFGSAYQYWIRCLRAGAEVRYSERILFLRRQHPEQMTAQTHLPENVLAVDRLLQPFLDQVPPVLAGRIRAALLLTAWRTIAWHCGLRSASSYWAITPLHPAWFGPRVLIYFLLDTVATQTHYQMSQRLRTWGVRSLLGGAAALGSGAELP